MIVTVTTEVTEVDAAPQAHQQRKQDEKKTPLRLVEAGHLLQDRIDYFHESLCSGGVVVRDPIIRVSGFL